MAVTTGKRRIEYPEPATKAFGGSAYSLWCERRRIPKVLVRARGKERATILWDATPIERLIGEGWPDEEERSDLERIIESVAGKPVPFIGGLFFGFVDLTELTFPQVARLAEEIAVYLDGRFGVEEKAPW